MAAGGATCSSAATMTEREPSSTVRSAGAFQRIANYLQARAGVPVSVEDVKGFFEREASADPLPHRLDGGRRVVNRVELDAWIARQWGPAA